MKPTLENLFQLAVLFISPFLIGATHVPELPLITITDDIKTQMVSDESTFLHHNIIITK
ncbi:MAG: hypothetical protein KAH08_05250 [Methylococcales bacterium]|nr:hypothetical protein [Methylococcales bacterium]